MSQLFNEPGDHLLALTLPWTPRAKGRPRMTKTGHTYTPKETKDAETALRHEFIEQCGETFMPIDGPIQVHFDLSNNYVDIDIYRIEDYTSRKLRGDIDNYIKLVGDALNGFAYVDDRQIGIIQGRKL